NLLSNRRIVHVFLELIHVQTKFLGPGREDTGLRQLALVGVNRVVVFPELVLATGCKSRTASRLSLCLECKREVFVHDLYLTRILLHNLTKRLGTTCTERALEAR